MKSKLTGEMPVPSLSTEILEQSDANVNEDYEYCLERMKTRGRTISLAGHDNVSVARVACLHKPQSCYSFSKCRLSL